MSMGVVSREVVPACEKLCFICPSLRTRSRHPVKRYKKLLAEIFPRIPVRYSDLLHMLKSYGHICCMLYTSHYNYCFYLVPCVTHSISAKSCAVNL